MAAGLLLCYFPPVAVTPHPISSPSPLHPFSPSPLQPSEERPSVLQPNAEGEARDDRGERRQVDQTDGAADQPHRALQLVGKRHRIVAVEEIGGAPQRWSRAAQEPGE